MDTNIDDDVPMQRASYAATHYLPYAALALALISLTMAARWRYCAPQRGGALPATPLLKGAEQLHQGGGQAPGAVTGIRDGRGPGTGV